MLDHVRIRVIRAYTKERSYYNLQSHSRAPACHPSPHPQLQSRGGTSSTGGSSNNRSPCQYEYRVIYFRLWCCAVRYHAITPVTYIEILLLSLVISEDTYLCSCLAGTILFEEYYVTIYTVYTYHRYPLCFTLFAKSVLLSYYAGTCSFWTQK